MDGILQHEKKIGKNNKRLHYEAAQPGLAQHEKETVEASERNFHSDAYQMSYFHSAPKI